MLNRVLPLCLIGLSGQFSPAWAQEGEVAPSSPEVPPASPEVQPASPEPAPEVIPEVSPQDLPEGTLPRRNQGIDLRGYIRSEFKYHVAQVEEVYDPLTGQMIEMGSPYQVYDLLPLGTHEGYVEANFELKYAPVDRFKAYSDTSLVFNTLPPATSTFEVFADDVAAATGTQPALDVDSLPQARITKRAQERILINELYASAYLGDHLALVAGKKRTYWGAAFTWSPMDVVNPAKNPLEPTLEREGAWSVLTDLVFDNFTASLLYAPYERDNSYGLPTTWDFTQGKAVARLYVKPFYQDLNLAAVYENKRLKGAATYSGYPGGGTVEVHAEVLAEKGRDTWLVSRRTPTSDLPELEAPWTVAQSELDSGRPTADVLVGGRYNFLDNSFLLAEYYFRSGGLNTQEYEIFSDYLTWMETTLPSAAAQADALISSSSENAASTPQTYADDFEGVVDSWTDMLTGTPWLFQDVYLRKHYGSVAYQKTRLFGETDVRMSAIVGLEDMSLFLYPAFESRLKQSLLLTGGVILVVAPEGAQGRLFPDKAIANLRMTAYF